MAEYSKPSTEPLGERQEQAEHDASPEAAMWRSARTLQEFGALTALWLEDSLGPMPTTRYYLYPSQETALLLTVLVPLNRSGNFVTTGSQPGCLPNNRPLGGTMSEQRAAVYGFVAMEKFEAFQAVIQTRKELRLVASPPGSPSNGWLDRSLVSRKNGEDYTWFGCVDSPDEIARVYHGLQPAVITALQQCMQVCVYDPEWGRNDLLWPTLESVAEIS